jgi:hypothetical protein
MHILVYYSIEIIGSRLKKEYTTNLEFLLAIAFVRTDAMLWPGLAWAHTRTRAKQ